MRIEKLTSNYADQIRILYKNELEEFYLLGTVYQHQNKKLVNYLKFICEEELEKFFGIVQDNELLAVVQYKEVNRCFHINNIVVSSLCQGNGFGKILLSWVTEQAVLEGLNVSLDVDSSNIKALDWYLSRGFEIYSESRSSVFKLDSQTPNKIRFYDDHNHIDFGFSNADIEDIDNLEFFFIEPGTFRLKSSMVVEAELLDRLRDSIDGFLVVDSNSLSSDTMSTSIYNKVVFKMVKNVI